MDFLDTFSLSSRRWCHELTFFVSFLRPYLRRAVCVVARTGVDVMCRGARRALFCVDSDVCLVKLLFCQARTGLVHTLGRRGRQVTRPRQALCAHRVERHAPPTRRHTTLKPGSLADYSTRIFRRVQAPIRQRDCSAHPPRRPPWQLFIAPAAARPGTQQGWVSRRVSSSTCDGNVVTSNPSPAAEAVQKVWN